MGFNPFEYDRKLMEWATRHLTQESLDNINKTKPSALPVAYIFVAMKYFVDNVKNSPQYEENTEEIDRDVEYTQALLKEYGRT